MSNGINIHIHIGIDPDVEKSGIAVWDSELKQFDFIQRLTFWQIIDVIDAYSEPIEVVIEAGWLSKKSNWHGNTKQSKQVGETIAKNVGRNHQIGILLEQYCKLSNIRCLLMPPRGKVIESTFVNLTKWDSKTNQDERDAAMLVWQRESIIIKEQIKHAI